MFARVATQATKVAATLTMAGMRSMGSGAPGATSPAPAQDGTQGPVGTATNCPLLDAGGAALAQSDPHEDWDSPDSHRPLPHRAKGPTWGPLGLVELGVTATGPVNSGEEALKLAATKSPPAVQWSVAESLHIDPRQQM
jgi:hypothetical protein